MSTLTHPNFNSRRIGDLLPDALALAMNPPQGVKMQWWPNLTRLMGGLRPHELTILCAPTGSGKTELLGNIVAQNILAGIPQFCAPVETGDLDFTNRAVGALSQLALNSGEPVTEEQIASKVGPHLEKIQSSETYVTYYRNRVKVQEMIDTLEFHVQQYGCQVAVLDNLNFFLDVTRASDTLIEMDRAVHDFVIMSQRLPIHTILVMHPRKTDGGRIESEFDIKGSSTAVQEADNVMLFNRPKKEEVESGQHTWFEREIVFKKLRRRGWNINKPVWLTFNINTFRYGETSNEIIRRPDSNRR